MVNEEWDCKIGFREDYRAWYSSGGVQTVFELLLSEDGEEGRTTAALEFM